MFKVQKRDGFSDRNGIKRENTEIQIIDLDKRTRNHLISTITLLYKELYDRHGDTDSRLLFCRYVMSDIYAEPFDYRTHYDIRTIISIIVDTIDNDDYDSVLTIIESLSQFWNQNYSSFINSYFNTTVFELFNGIFEKEYVGYRFVGERIERITDDLEIDSINEALCSPYKEVTKHIDKALEKFSDRNKPDYENSIKESISAVEAMCEIITGAKGNDATLGKMLKKLEDSGVDIHKSLKTAFNQLYSYTNDANGIRHAGDIGGASSTFEEAKFMLVSCCAFINYLKGIQSKIN